MSTDERTLQERKCANCGQLFIPSFPSWRKHDTMLGCVRAQQAAIERLTGHNRELDLALISMTKLHDVVAAERDARDTEVRALRGFAQSTLYAAQSGRGDIAALVEYHRHGLLDDKGNPTPLLTGEQGGDS